MSRKKSYRGQGKIKNNFNKCSYFHCVGTDKGYINKIKENIIDKELKKIIYEFYTTN